MKEEREEKKSKQLRVVVHYPAAAEPFHGDADPEETVGQLKARVLAAFALSESQTPDGNTTTYTLFDKKMPLDNLGQKLGEVAGDQPVLQLKLSQQITQG
jgi:hypothetical protein